MTILILAGGISKRMWPLQTDKLLLPFMGKPFFYHTLKSFSNLIGENKVVIVANERNREGLEKVTKELGIKAEFTIQTEALGMANAIVTAEKYLDGPVLVVNGDDLLEPEIYSQLFHAIETEDNDILLVGKVVKDYFPGGYIAVEGDKVTKVVEKPGAGNEPSDVVKLVLDYYKDAKLLIETIKKDSDQDHSYEKALDEMVSGKLNGAVLRYEGEWGALKYPWHILHLTELLLKRIEPKISEKATIAKNAVVDGAVIIEDNVKIFEGAVVKGPCYIGEGSIIGNNSLVRESMLGSNVVTGYTTEIARSWVGENSWFHTNYIGDSVIEGDFGMGSGAVTANLRLDNKTIRTLENTIDTGLTKLGIIAGKGVRVGINAMTMPGVCLGANSLVGPGALISKNVSENKRILVKQDHIESENKEITGYDQFREKLES